MMKNAIGGFVKKVTYVITVSAMVVSLCGAASAQEVSPAAQISAAQGNVPQQAQQAESAVSSAVRKWGIGVEGGVGLNPELIMFGAHGTFGPVFTPNVQFRPGFEFGIGEVTTLFGINLDVLYTFPGASAQTRWSPYLGAGPNFTLSHQGFSVNNGSSASSVTVNGNGTTTTTNNRFDFGDTNFDSGFNFIAGARSRGGLFVEMKATAYGVKNVRLMAGFNF
jgi:hypothetical protein